MRSATLVDATDLVFWTNRREAQDSLPRVIRQLVHATALRATRVEFRAGEGIQLAGWDGIVQTPENNAFVPEGVSGWEIGTRSDPKDQATENYEKRTTVPGELIVADSTFIFVTARRWAGKAAWAADRRAEKRWKNVRGYDADDLEAWLDLAPAVHVALSIQLGKRPVGAIDVETFWQDWTSVTDPQFPPELILAGRKKLKEELIAWLQSSNNTLALQAESESEAVAVFAATLETLPSSERAGYLSRAVIATDSVAWNQLAASSEPLILLPLFSNRSVVAGAMRNGHSVLIPLGRADNASSETLKVPPLSREEVQKAFVALGNSDDKAGELALQARRSMDSVRRRLAKNPEIQQPAWSRPAEAVPLIPLIFAGRWKDKCDGDRDALCSLAQRPYSELAQLMVRWGGESDAPVRRIGDDWFVVNLDDAWCLLERFVTRDDLTRFEKLCVEAFGAYDPKFDLPLSKRWHSGISGEKLAHSSRLRKGLAETLAIMGVRGVRNVTAESRVSDWSIRITRQIFEHAHADWRIWATIAPVLPELAEAAPETFLDAVTAGLVGDDPIILKLFERNEEPLFGGSSHPSLLWALETLAWNSEYLACVALILAKLARLDPGGNTGNRPMSSLAQIFILWHPQTAADLKHRIRVIDILRSKEPEISWRLLMALTPREQDVAMPTAKPHWRDWVPDRPSNVIDEREWRDGIQEITKRLLLDVGKSAARWPKVIETVPELSFDMLYDALNQLSRLNPSEYSDEERGHIADACRKVVSHHRTYITSDNSPPANELKQLADACQRFECSSSRFSWLFDYHPKFLEGAPEDWKEHEKLADAKRLDAVRTLFNEGGFLSVKKLVANSKPPGRAGWILGRTELGTDDETDPLIVQSLAADSPEEKDFTLNFVGTRIRKRGFAWGELLTRRIQSRIAPKEMGILLACFPNNLETWKLAENLGSEIENHYWGILYPYSFEEGTVIEIAVRKFLWIRRPYAAIELLAHKGIQEGVSADLIVEAIQALVKGQNDECPRANSTLDYSISQLLDTLESTGNVQEKILVSFEWFFHSLLERRRPSKALNRSLAKDPEFFVEIIKWAFCAKGAPRVEVDERERANISQAFWFLHTLRLVPGLTDDGQIDGQALENWISNARSTASACGRGNVADTVIGQMLGNAPTDPDGFWPHLAIRALLEKLECPKIDDGIVLGVRSGSDGMVIRWTGGDRERDLSIKYQCYASALCDRWPRTAAMLRKVADSYSSEARFDEIQAELRDNLER